MKVILHQHNSLRKVDVAKTANSTNWQKPRTLFLQILIAITFSFGFSQQATAQLNTGDLAFTSFNADEDGWSLVTFVDIPANTIIYFTDNEAQSATSFNTGESYHQWNTGGSIIPAGTVIRFSAIDNVTSLAASAGTLTRLSVSLSTNYGLSTGGDTEYAYLANSGTPSTPVTFLAAISNDESPTLTDLSNAGLTNGVNALVLTSAASGPDYGEYNGPRNTQATFAAYKPLVTDLSNWAVDAIDGIYSTTVPNITAFTILTCTAPGQPTAFTAKTTFVYQGDNNIVYAIPNVAGVTYTWSYSGTGATISGTGNNVTVSYSSIATSGDLSVTAGNSCGTSAARTLAIYVNTPIAINTTNYDYSFVTVGCNRVDYLDTAFTTGDPDYSSGASTANVYQLKRLFNEIAHLNPLPKFLIMTGDIVMGYKTPSTPDTTELAKQLTAWKAIYESSPLASLPIQLVTIPGNHETQDKAAGKKSFIEAEQIFTRIMAPYIRGNNGPGIGGPDSLTTDQSKLTYSFDYNGDHYIMMNTDPVGKDNQVAYKWLAGDIQTARANNARHIFSFGHKPAYSSPLTPNGGLDAVATIPQRDSLWKYLETYNCEAMFSAHEHLWDTIHPNYGKTWQVIAGNGGSRVEPVWVGAGRQYYGYTLVNIYTDRKVNVMGLGRNTTQSTTAGGTPYPINEDANPTTVRNNFNICLTTTSTTNVIACGSYTWNGSTYTTSGSYTFLTTNAAGCDSIATLNLTISICGITGPSTSQSPYVQSVEACVKYTSILSANDSIGGYKMVGIPDGLGAFDNGDGTFTLLMNHELGNTVGIPRAHGSKGSFVSKWIINKSNLAVLSGSDLMQNVKLWDPLTSTYNTYNASNPSSLAAFSRFCSADLPAPAAFYNATSGLGTQERIFMNGEEANDESRAMAHIVTGTNAGTSWELPALGKAAWENSVATPNSGDRTVVGLMNDGTDGQVYFYIGTKTNTGSEVDKAGLTNGTPWGVVVSGFAKERINATTINPPPAPGTRFSLVNLGDVKNITGVTFNNNSNTAGITSFSRPEDGAWDPSNPNDFYFNTTDQYDQVSDGVGTQVGRTRVWRLRFDDVKNPQLGGAITAVLDGTEGLNMLDNMAIDKNGHMLLNEDVGNQAHNGKVWQYDIATDSLKLIGKHDPARFGDLTIAPTAPFNKDEETSGIIDMQDILGAGKFLLVDQAHYATGLPPEIVEGGQLLALDNPYAANQQGPSTTQSPYLLPVANGVQFASMLSANDSIGGYKMVGIPDGLGAFDNNNGTFTLLMNHELTNTVGVVRAHGSKGAFVSKWIINKSNLAVLSGSDLIQNVKLWDPLTSTYNTYNASNPSLLAAFTRFCSADLPAPAAFYNAASGLGTQERIFMNGEEASDESRAMAHIVTGTNAGTSWELPALGKAAWENSVATPNSGDKTVVGLMNDGTDGQVYFYIGTKTNTGSEVDKAGLTNGTPWGVLVSGFAKERINATTINPPPAPGTRFSLVDLGDVRNITGVAFNNNSNTAGITSFSRPEDGAWDPSNPNDFYFNTTDQYDQVSDGVGTQTGRTRVWRLRFDDVKNPQLGGAITAVLDGTEGLNMLDNMAIDKNGHMLLNEDVGNQAHNGKVWQYDIATDSLRLIGKHDPARFGDLTIAPTVPFNKDEETSGIIDVQDILGAGKFLLVDQAHYSTGLPPEIVEGGQLLALYNPYTINTPPTVTITSPANGATFNAGTIITLNVTAADANGSVTKVAFYNNGVKFGEDLTAPYSFIGMEVEPGIYVVTAKAFDNNGDSTVSDTVRITVNGCNGGGNISAEGYVNIPGSQVSDLTSSPKYPNSPDVTATLNSFEYGPNYGDNYGARVRGYICAPVTGYYTFYIAGDDQGGLWLSTNENPANKALIAYNESYVPFRGYFNNSTQKSAPIRLVKGARYYIETLHKESVGPDHLSVAWNIPGGAFEGPIPGSRLSPFGSLFPNAPNFDFAGAMENAMNKGLKVSATPNPSSDYFTITTKSSVEDRLNLTVSDITGRVLERRANISANSTIKLGNKLPAGIYIVEVAQGAKKQIIKVVKQ